MFLKSPKVWFFWRVQQRAFSRLFCVSLCFPLIASFPVSSLPLCCVQGSRGGYDFRSRWQQPWHRVGAGGSALWLQPKVQQAGQRCVSHALRPDLPETIPVGPLDRQICSRFPTISSLCDYTLLNIQPIYSCPTIGWNLKISAPFSAYLFVSQSTGRTSWSCLHLSPPDVTVL